MSRALAGVSGGFFEANIEVYLTNVDYGRDLYIIVATVIVFFLIVTAFKW
jgi:hypothetical protein